MAERPTLPPGVLPHITDTDPPPLHPATVIGEGVVYVDERKLAEHTRQAAQKAAEGDKAAH